MSNEKLKITTPRGSIFHVTTKDGSVKAELSWSPGFGGEYTRRFSNAQMWLDSEVLRYNRPYVPFDTGMLISSGDLGTRIGSGVVEYIAPYAKETYYTHKNYKDSPRRGAYHFERMKINHKEALLRGAGRIAGGR